MIDIIFLGMWWALLLVIVPKAAVHVRAMIFMIIMVAGVGFIVAHCYYDVLYPSYVMKDDIVLRIGPGEQYGSCGGCKKLDVVRVLRSQGGWKCIIKKSSFQEWLQGTCPRGWVPESTLDSALVCTRTEAS
jgi:uncharacterized protein YgiM (DUF1202 family)